MVSLGIRQRILFLVGVPTLLVAVLLTALFIAARLEEARDEQIRRLSAIVRQLAAHAEYPIFVGNREALEKLLTVAVREPDLDAAAIVDAQGRILASTVPTARLPEILALPDGFSAEGSAWRRFPIRAGEFSVGDTKEDAFAPSSASAPVGHILIAVNERPLRAEIAKQIGRALGISLLVLALGLVAAFLLAHRLIHLLVRIGAVVEAVGAGRTGARITDPGSDELGRLAEGINRMAERVEINQAELARRVAEATRALRAEKEAAEAAATARSRFFAAAGHDLRQPLQALALVAMRLERDARRSHLLPRIRQLNQSIRALQNLLDALLDYSRLSGGAMACRLQPVPAERAIAAVMKELAPIAAEKGLALRHHAARECWLITDPALLHRILLNLVGNALRYTSRGGVLIACRRRGAMARLEVWDTGPGIAPEQQESVFEELVQLDNPERDPAKGLGLGLAIVRRTADLLGHRLLLHSRPGKGSCFALEIPTTVPPPPSHHESEEGESLRLAVCGEGAITEEVAALLRRWGYVVSLFADVRNAAAAAARVPDGLVAVGEDLPSIEAALDAYDVQAQRAFPALIVLTGNASEGGTRDPARRRLLRYPFRPARLRALLDHLLLGE